MFNLQTSLNRIKQSTKLTIKSRDEYTLKCGDNKLKLGKTTKIMGIINLTPDSFSLDGCMKEGSREEDILRLALKQIEDGADILDIGGESSRPGSQRITEKEEISRIIPILKKITKTFKVPISVDTYKSKVAKEALDSGATIVNNIMGTQCDLELLKMVKNYDANIVLMHMQGTPENMQKNYRYKNVIREIMEDLNKSIEQCLSVGIKENQMIIDPGVGFGKSVEHNLSIINHLNDFKALNKPLLIGLSRKSFIGHILNNDVDERLHGSIAGCVASIMNGAHIVRVHDVKESKEAALIADSILLGGIAK